MLLPDITAGVAAQLMLDVKLLRHLDVNYPTDSLEVDELRAFASSDVSVIKQEPKRTFEIRPSLFEFRTQTY